MRLNTKLVLASTVFSTVLTASLLVIFFVQLLRVRLNEAAAANTTLGQGLLLSTRRALASGIEAQPHVGSGEISLEQAVIFVLQQDTALHAEMDAIVRYAPIVQDVSISGANGKVLLSTDPLLLNSPPPSRSSFDAAVHGNLRSQLAFVFGKPKVLEAAFALQRNGKPFLYAHLGVRSTLLRNALTPWLNQAFWVGVTALGCSVLGAYLLSSLALRPVQEISYRLGLMGSKPDEVVTETAHEGDALQQAHTNLERIDAQMRLSAERASNLETNLSQMLHTLRDGILLLSSDGEIIMASDAMQQFVAEGQSIRPGIRLNQVFLESTPLGSLLLRALLERQPLQSTASLLENGNPVEVTLAFPSIGIFPGRSGIGAMLTLHNPIAQQALEQEIEVGRRLASIGRLTAGVGHEVKNPINAMVLHLELLRSKLRNNKAEEAGRHVDVLASEMSRLDRVVQTLADFTRPLDPDMHDQTIRPIVEAVLHLVSIDAAERGIHVEFKDDAPLALAMVDDELLHQALLNIVLNAMDAMLDGGTLTVAVQRTSNSVQISIRDTGHGIPADLLDRIFHLYFTTKSTGTGIGLAMTWRMVQMMGGTITVLSSTEQDSSQPGTLFTVAFPLSSASLRSTSMQEAHA